MQNNNGYILEFVKNGGYIKVSAIDPKTGQEACVIVPSKGITRSYMETLAIRKLKYVQDKANQES